MLEWRFAVTFWSGWREVNTYVYKVKFAHFKLLKLFSESIERLQEGLR